MLSDVLLSIPAKAVELHLYIVGIVILAFVCQDVFNATYFWWNRPRGVSLVGPSLAFGKWWSSLQFILNAPQLIRAGYAKSESVPFAIPSREGYLVFVTSEKHIREVESAPQDQLSFHAAMQDRLKLKQTFNGFELGSIDPHDSVPIRTLKTLLRIDIPLLRPKFQDIIENTFKSAVSKESACDKGWTKIAALSLSEELSLRINSEVIFGTELANNRDFVKAAHRYHQQAVIAMLSAHYLPNWTDKYFVSAMMSLGGAMGKVDTILTRAVNQRLQDMQDGKSDIPRDGITWVIEASTKEELRSVRRIVQQLFAIFFASAHQLPVLLMFALYRLCQHPEYMKPLVSEAEDMMKLHPSERYKRVPLLESFLREAARYDPLDSLSVQRKVLKPFAFSDGGVVPAGNVICVPQQAIMRDSRHYARPDEFQPFRFVAENHSEDAEQKFTDVVPGFYLWGAPKNPCPGRWYASAVLKQTFAHLLTNYNFKLADPTAGLTVTYTTIVYPRPGIELLMQER